MAEQPRLFETREGSAPGDNAECDRFRESLRQCLHDPAFRAIEGFPIGDDEAILALSDPPYYTACPNPFLSEIVERWQAERCQVRAKLGLPTDTRDVNDSTSHQEEGSQRLATEGMYHREPFAADVSEGKNDPIYNAHSYHTKVPHRAIMRYILHYTDPGDIVFDGFCGTGMTGVAAQLCGDRKAVEGLGYYVDDNGAVYDEGKVISQLGTRKSAMADLSPAATFIAYNYNTPISVTDFEREAKRVLAKVKHECGWMYETWHPNDRDTGRVKGTINFTVWSEIFVCPQCSGEVTFLDEALNPDTKRVAEAFPCPHCGASVGKRSLDKYRTTIFDPVLGRTVETLKREPVIIEYAVGRLKYTKRVDESDRELLAHIAALAIPEGFLVNELPYMHMTHQRVRIANYGVTHLHHLFFPRARHVLGAVKSLGSCKMIGVAVQAACAVSLDFAEVPDGATGTALPRRLRYS